jgi:hypothetical protein
VLIDNLCAHSSIELTPGEAATVQQRIPRQMGQPAIEGCRIEPNLFEVNEFKILPV